jgi:cobyrinic acid a,c-diamide synthase
MAGTSAIPRLVVGGVSSGVGKTTVTIALARALRARGLRVALFKAGPDYLDPTYHARAVGSTSQNLDGWMMGRDAVLATFADASRDADVALVEGVMGLFDGASATSEDGSTAQIAKWLCAPVALVIDARGMARSIAAVAQGFVAFDPDVHVAAVIANHLGSRGHLDLLRLAQKSPPVLGGLPRDEKHAFPERHLGLWIADDATVPESLLDELGEVASSWIEIDALLDVARTAPPIAVPDRGGHSGVVPRCRIGVARDAAFCFYYADNLRRLEALGAELVAFSPIADAALPEVDGLYLGGGYPELFAPTLTANVSMRAAVRLLAEQGAPVYAECGGLMYLARAIVTADGTRHPMVGLVPGEAWMRDKLQALGYVEVETQAETLLGGSGTRFRGHQFRYSELVATAASGEQVYSVRRRRGGEPELEGYRVGNVLASYVHAHWASNPSIPEAIVRGCVRFKEDRVRPGRIQE